MIAAVQAHWGLGSRILAETFLPDASREAVAAFTRQQRDAATAETAAELLSLAYAIDVAADLPHLEAETLVLHRKKDRCVPAEAARRLASGLSKARLVLLEGSGHPPWEDGDQIADRATPSSGRTTKAAVADVAADVSEVRGSGPPNCGRRHARGLTTRWSRRWRGRSGGGRCWTRVACDAGGFGPGEGRAPSYVSRVLRLTLLAPEIVEAILDGRQPAACSWMICWRVFRWIGRAGALGS